MTLRPLAYVVAATLAIPASAQFLSDAPRYFPLESRPAAKAASTAPLDRASIMRIYHTLYLPSESVPSGWTGSVATCQPGMTSAAFKQAVLDRVNTYRRIAGLPSVGLFTDQRAIDAQNAALMMSANNSLDHSPPSSWRCYTSSGANGAGNSNLGLGFMGFDAVDGYIDDFGSGNEAVGHRRWILYPPLANIATGDIPSGGQPASNSLWVLGPFGTRPSTPNGIAWPRGFVPWDMLPGSSNRWSFSYPGATFGGGVIVNGAAATLETQSQGFGDNTLVFRPAGVSYSRPDGEVRYSVTVNGVSNASATSFTYPVTVFDAEPLDASLAGDVNGDGKSDLLWRNEKSGETHLWLMNGTTFTGGGLVLQSTVWRPVATGDFNGDGRTDILWRNESTGDTHAWLMNGMQILATAPLLNDGNWLPTHTGDLDGNGSADIVWRNLATGESALWLMSGTQVANAAVFGFDGNPGWRVTHVADLDGDGRADLIARNETSGITAAWRMNGLTVVSASALLGASAWRVSHVGDFNGDGRADLVWRNDTTGDTHAWLMNGLAISATSSLLSSLRDWSVAQLGDFNGDGRSDILWRNRTTGQTHMWLMNGLALSATRELLVHPQWQPARIGNFDGNLSATNRPVSDILWRNSRSGQHAIWTMNGTSATATSIVLDGAAWWASP
ncbi:MAG TPA: FG-GAP-like repeat-containing protein [Casimicrobiaceae bacterium]|nr:FG-GAP-like repeat-containing protein [Casimicrobiaceae bacterium]